jgi:hypothetical protein
MFTFTRFIYILHTITFYHSIRSILCLQQTGEIDNLVVSWGKVLGYVVCRFHVAAGEKLHADKQFIWRPCPECREASEHQPSEIWLSPTGLIKSWFHN